MSVETIQLEHGAGGRMSQDLVVEVIAAGLGAAHTGRMEDSGVVNLGGTDIAITTDSFVLDPLFFRNGDIGKLAVCGTVNDLAVSGAMPRFLTLSLVIEEGFPIGDLARIVESVRETAVEAEVAIVAGDTKVVRGGEIDKLFINTTGVGEFTYEHRVGVTRIQPGDAIIVTGWLGNHSIHILSLREGLGFEQHVLSDCAPLDGLVWNVLEEFSSEVHCMRDITRGGLGTVLNELAIGASVSIRLQEESLPIQRETAMAADMLGVHPLYLANEGSICMFVEADAAEEILELVRWQPSGHAAQIVGEACESCESPVTMLGCDGARSVVAPLGGQQLPRLC